MGRKVTTFCLRENVHFDEVEVNNGGHAACSGYATVSLNLLLFHSITIFFLFCRFTSKPVPFTLLSTFCWNVSFAAASVIYFVIDSQILLWCSTRSLSLLFIYGTRRVLIPLIRMQTCFSTSLSLSRFFSFLHQSLQNGSADAQNKCLLYFGQLGPTPDVTPGESDTKREKRFGQKKSAK